MRCLRPGSSQDLPSPNATVPELLHSVSLDFIQTRILASLILGAIISLCASLFRESLKS